MMSIGEKLLTIAKNNQSIYNKGFADGQSQGGNTGGGNTDNYDKGFTDGQETMLDIFWNGIQDNGNKKDYQNAFRGWKNAHNYWKPNHDIKPNGAGMMFYAFTSDLGLPELCERAGINPIDFSAIQTFGQTFSYARIPDVGTIDTTNAKGLSSIFLYANVQKAHLILKADGSQMPADGAFTGANTLTDLTIEGAIGNSWIIPSPLTPESMISVITHLVNYAGTDQELAYTITFTDACWDALESSEKKPYTEGLTDDVEKNWKDYVYSLGWNA